MKTVSRKLELFDKFAQKCGLTSYNDPSFITKEQLLGAIDEIQKWDSRQLPKRVRQLLSKSEQTTVRQATAILRRWASTVGCAVITKKVWDKADGVPTTLSFYRLAH